SSYADLGSPWSSMIWDDGWWLDDIKFTGLVTHQTTPIVDTRPAPGGVCPSPLCVDADGDGYFAPGAPRCTGDVPFDCDDTRAATFPGADEINDGLDNQCPGSSGYGLVDELGDTVEFFWLGTPGREYILEYGYQVGATQYDLVYSSRKDFSGGCTVQS